MSPLRSLSVALALVAAPVAAAPSTTVPPRVEVTYELRYNDMLVAELTEVLETRDGRYTIASEAKGRGLAAALPLGPFKQWSEGRVTREGLRPERYRDQRGPSRISIAELDWSAGVLKLSHRGKIETRPLEGAVHDRLTFAFTHMFAALPRDAVRMQITDGRGLSESRFSVVREEMVRTPLGEIAAVKATKDRLEPDDPQVEVWLSKAHYHLPVRMVRIDRDGKRFDQVATRIDLR